MDKLDKQQCPMCNKNTCTLTEDEIDIPFFGKTFTFGMDCSSCGFHMADIEAEEKKKPIKITFTTESDKDMKIRIVKSSKATIKIPTLKVNITPGSDSEGYVSNIEGLLKRIKKVIEQQRDAASSEGDKPAKTTAKNLLKKIWKIECGDIPMKIIIEDPTGNSAIISDKVVKK